MFKYLKLDSIEARLNRGERVSVGEKLALYIAGGFIMTAMVLIPIVAIGAIQYL